MLVAKTAAPLASGLDRLFRAVAIDRPRKVVDDPRARIEFLESVLARHARAPFDVDRARLFADQGQDGSWIRRPVRALGRRGDVVDVRWSSNYEPLAPEADLKAQYLLGEANHRADARLFLHRDRPRPAVLLVHGYLGGIHRFEERAWPLRLFFDELGLDVALFALPFHGSRRHGRWPSFPAADPRFNIEGFRHAVFDLRALKRRLEARGAPAVGMMGMSLGGYTTALAATVDPTLAFAVPMIPLASFADFVHESGRFTGTGSQRIAQHEALERAYAPASPLSAPSMLDSRRVLIIAADADRITPMSHARRLASHFDAPLHAIPGGHLLQLGRSGGFQRAATMLRDLGLTSAPKR